MTTAERDNPPDFWPVARIGRLETGEHTAEHYAIAESPGPKRYMQAGYIIIRRRLSISGGNVARSEATSTRWKPCTSYVYRDIVQAATELYRDLNGKPGFTPHPEAPAPFTQQGVLFDTDANPNQTSLFA